MRIMPLGIIGTFILVPAVHADHRGFFSRTFDRAILAQVGIHDEWVQHNQSRSVFGTARGLHVRGGTGEAKIVRCSSGTILEHIVDLRPASPTFLQVEELDLDDVAMAQLYLPPFVAHGYQVLSEVADVCYLHSRAYVAGMDLAFDYRDPQLGIEMRFEHPLMSDRDLAAPCVSDVDLTALWDAGAVQESSAEQGTTWGVGTGE